MNAAEPLNIHTAPDRPGAVTADWERRLVERCKLAIRQCLTQANSECRVILATMGEPRRENLLQAISDAFSADSALQCDAFSEAFGDMKHVLNDLEMDGP